MYKIRRAPIVMSLLRTAAIKYTLKKYHTLQFTA